MTAQSHSIDRFRNAFLLLLVAGISLAFFYMIRDFVTTLLLAAITTGLCNPMHQRLVRLFNGRTALASALTLVIVIFVIIGPLLTFLGLVAAQALEVADGLRPWLESRVGPSAGHGLLPTLKLPEILAPYEREIMARVGEVTAGLGRFLFDSLASVTKGTAQLLIALFVMLYAMFFFLRDGHALLSRIFYYMPLRSEDELRMAEKFVSVSRATLKGTIAVGIAQGGLAGAAFAVIGINGAAFWGTVMAVLSIIPGLGTALVWVPAAAWLYLNGQIAAALGLTIWCVAVVSTIDNLLRPRLVGRDTQMSDLLILLSTLGGLLLFGPMGILIGPILGALFVTVWEIYGEAFADYLPDADLSETSASIVTGVWKLPEGAD